MECFMSDDAATPASAPYSETAAGESQGADWNARCSMARSSAERLSKRFARSIRSRCASSSLSHCRT